MLFGTAFAIFLVPVLFVVVERISHRGQGTRLRLVPTPEVKRSEQPGDRTTL
jgi:hypothetical protein